MGLTYQERKVLARQADIAEICRKMGVEIEKEKYSKKGEYRVVGHGGLVICANGYYCHSNPDGRLDNQPKNSGNNAISFVMYFFGKSYSEALDIILGDGYNYTRHDTTHYTPQPFQPAQIKQIPEKSDNYKNVFAYLCKSRCLSPSVVQMCIDTGLLYQDTHRNAVFVCKDEQGKTIGFEIKGTNTQIAKPFKRTEGNAVFRFVCGQEQPSGVIAFESAIDLLSYYDIYRQKLTHHLLLSMAGCRYEILEQILTAHPDYAVGVATDNDDKGKAFYESLCQQRADLRIFRVAPAHGKDWNDTLKHIRKGV